MIHTITFCDLSEQMSVTPFGGVPVYINPWDVLKKCLAGTNDIVVFVVTRTQLYDFEILLKRYGLEKYLIVDHRGEGRGVTNRNYPHDPLRLKVFVLEGEKQ